MNDKKPKGRGDAIDRLNTALLKHEVMSEMDQLIRAPLLAITSKVEMLEKAVKHTLPADKQRYFAEIHDEMARLLMTLKVLTDAGKSAAKSGG